MTPDGILARALTVEASRLYALLAFRAELDVSPMPSAIGPDRDAPGAAS